MSAGTNLTHTVSPIWLSRWLTEFVLDDRQHVIAGRTYCCLQTQERLGGPALPALSSTRQDHHCTKTDSQGHLLLASYLAAPGLLHGPATRAAVGTASGFLQCA